MPGQGWRSVVAPKPQLCHSLDLTVSEVTVGHHTGDIATSTQTLREPGGALWPQGVKPLPQVSVPKMLTQAWPPLGWSPRPPFPRQVYIESHAPGQHLQQTQERHPWAHLSPEHLCSGKTLPQLHTWLPS